MKQSLVLVLLLSACQADPAESVADQSITAACSARDHNAIPGDGIDDLAALQATFNACGGGVVTLEAGQYDVVTPSPRHGIPMLTLPAGTTLEGVGTASVIQFSGNVAGADWRGIQLGNNTTVRKLTLTNNFAPGTTTEQSPIIRGDGPLHDVTINDVTINHPSRNAKSGDCIQFVGYPPVDGSPDKRIYNANVNHVTFQRCDRSGIAVHSGLHGTLVGDHWTSRFNNNVFVSISDQDIDGEGSGDTDGVEIDNNHFLLPNALLESGISVSIMASSHIHLHHNVFDARGIDLYGCSDCELDHNVVTQSVANGQPVIYLRKQSSRVQFHDETYTRNVSAGAGPIIGVAQKISAPDHVSITDSQLIQHTDGAGVASSGIVGLEVVRSSIAYDGTPSTPQNRIDAMVFEGSSNDNATRTTGLRVIDSVVTGPYRSVVTVSGSYAGAGTLELTGTRSSGTQEGLRCENIVSANGGGITGPITYAGNTLPAPGCSPLVP